MDITDAEKFQKCQNQGNKENELIKIKTQNLMRATTIYFVTEENSFSLI